MQNVRKTLYIHIGLHKTGTTSIQRCLSHGASYLHQAGVLYPNVGRHPRAYIQHGLLPKAFDLDRPHGGVFALACPLDGNLVLSALLHEIELSGLHRIVISSEEFSRLMPEEIRKVGSAFQGFDIRPVAFVRNFPALFDALYGTLVLHTDKVFPPSIDMVDTNITPQFEAWASIAGKGKIHVIDYDASPSRNSVEDFLQAIAVSPDIFPVKLRTARLNKSLPSGAIARLRASRGPLGSDVKSDVSSNLPEELRSTLAAIYTEQMRTLRAAPFVEGLMPQRASPPFAKRLRSTTTLQRLRSMVLAKRDNS